MTTEIILTIVSCVFTLAAIVIGYYQHIKKVIQEQALDAINKAEDTDKIGKEKMKEAVATIYNIIPVVAKPFITEAFIETIVQCVFDKIEEYAKKQLNK